MRTVGYIRVSSQEQAEHGVSLDMQRAKIEAYCQLKDLQLVEVIEDAGLSAKNLKRPGVQRIIELARSKQIDAVVILKLDRMFRSVVDAIEVTRNFDKWGVALHSLAENLDTNSAMGRFFFTLTAALAEMERGIVSERTKQALSRKKERGERIGEVPYGYSDANGQLVSCPEEQRVISMMLELESNGLTKNAIARELNARGVPTKKGKSWHCRQVIDVLRAA